MAARQNRGTKNTKIEKSKGPARETHPIVILDSGHHNESSGLSNVCPDTVDLEDACLLGDLKIVKELIETHNLRPTQDHLFFATAGESLRVTKYLIETHNLKPSNRALKKAINMDNRKILEYFLKKGFLVSTHK